MATTPTQELLRELAGFRAERGQAISLFLNLDPSVTPTAGDTQSRVNSLLVAGERSESATSGDLSHEAKQGLRSDFERIGRYFEDSFDRDGARGVAVFSAGLDGMWRPLELASEVEDGIEVARQFHIAPLAPLVASSDGAIVAVVGREQGTVYRVRAGRLEEVVDRSDAQHGQHAQGGPSQAGYQRHIEHLVQEHLESVGEVLDRSVRRSHIPGIVVVGTDELRAEFVEQLSSEAREAVVGSAHVEAHADPAHVLQAVLPVLEEARAKDEERTIERWREGAGRGERATSGWQDTLEAASDARIDTLIYGAGADRAAWECPQCGRATADPGECPLDGTELEPREHGIDLAIKHTLTQGGTVLAVQHHQDLEPVEGIGALLRF